METVLCAAVGTASYKNRLEACTVYGDCTVCSCRHSKSSESVRKLYCVWRPTVCSCRHSKLSESIRSMYCVWRPYCAAVGTANHQNGLEACTVYGDLLCAAVGTASQQLGLEACNVYVDCTVCSCRHSKSSAWVRRMYCVWGLYCVQL